MKNNIKKISAFVFALSFILAGCKATNSEVQIVDNNNNDKEPEETTKDTNEIPSVTETAETTATSPEVTTVPVGTTVPEETTTPKITTTEATTTTVITTTVPETTTTVPETTTVVTTTTAPVTTTTVITTPAHPVGYDDQMTQEWIDATNAERRRLGLNELKIDQTLMNCAAIRAKESCEHNYLAHKRPNGDSWKTVMPESYFWMARGENTARTSNTTNGIILCQKYSNSSDHYANMIETSFGRVGASTYHDGQGRVYSCMIFTD